MTGNLSKIPASEIVFTANNKTAIELAKLAHAELLRRLDGEGRVSMLQAIAQNALLVEVNAAQKKFELEDDSIEMGLINAVSQVRGLKGGTIEASINKRGDNEISLLITSTYSPAHVISTTISVDDTGTPSYAAQYGSARIDLEQRERFSDPDESDGSSSEILLSTLETFLSEACDAAKDATKSSNIG